MIRRLRNSRKFRLYKEAKRELCGRYPAAFPPVGKRPALKIGILDDLRADGDLAISITNCRRFLSIWTRSTAYLCNMRAGMPRVGLDGETHEAITESHQKEARKTLSDRKNARLR